MATGSSLVNAIKAYRQAYKQEKSHLSPEALDRDWTLFWNSVSNEVTGSFGSGSNVFPPLRRPSSSIVQLGTDSSASSSSPKRGAAGGHHLSTAASSVPTAPCLQRQASAPAAGGVHAPDQARNATHPTPALVVGSSNVAQRCAPRRASNPTSTSFRPFARPGLANIDEVPVYASEHVLARSLDGGMPTPPVWLERGEYVTATGSQATQVTATTAPSQLDSADDGLLTPPISDSGLPPASTASSQPMSRSNTDDVLLLDGVGMMRVDSHSSAADSVDMGLGAHDDFAFVDGHGTLAYDGLSLSSFFPFAAEMKHCSPSQDGPANTSSHPSVSLQTCLLTPAKDQAALLLRRLEPKQSHDDSASPQKQPAASSSQVRLVEMTLDDGTKVKKAEISRAARQQPPRKTTFCPHCNEQPQGFHGDHELNRHIDRQHRSIRKVWICRDISSNGFLDGCKACRHQKTYGANYNAAAHLRRAHFNPCKNKRGGRGKKSEGRGGIGGGNKPSMEELKNWMYAVYEIVVDGDVVDMQPIPPEGHDDFYAPTMVTAAPLADMADGDFDTTTSSPYDMAAASLPPSAYPTTTTTTMMMAMDPSLPLSAPLSLAPQPLAAQDVNSVTYMQMPDGAVYNWPDLDDMR